MFNFDLIVRKTNNYSFSSLPSPWFISENGGGGIVWGWGWNQKPQGHYSICNDTTAQKARCKGWLSAHTHTIIMLSAHAHTIITYPQNLGVLYESWSVWVQVSPQFCHVNSGVSGRKMGFWVQTLTFLLGFFGILWIHRTQGLSHAKCTLLTTELQPGSYLTYELQSLLYKPQATSWRILGRIKWMKELKLNGIQKIFKRLRNPFFHMKMIKKESKKKKNQCLNHMEMHWPTFTC